MFNVVRITKCKQALQIFLWFFFKETYIIETVEFQESESFKQESESFHWKCVFRKTKKSKLHLPCVAVDRQDLSHQDEGLWMDDGLTPTLQPTITCQDTFVYIPAQ